MKKIPTLFKRTFDEHHRKHIINEVTPGLGWVLEGRGIATVKYTTVGTNWAETLGLCHSICCLLTKTG